MVHANNGGVRTIEAICQGSSSGSADDTEDLEAGNLTGILGGLSLSIVGVNGNAHRA